MRPWSALKSSLRSALRRGAGAVLAAAGGDVTRFDPEFRPPRHGPNARVEIEAPSVRARARYLWETNPNVHAAVESVIDDVVGRGVRRQPNTGHARLDQKLAARWDFWQERCDPSRRGTLDAVQRQFLGELLITGEALRHVPIMDAFAGMPKGPALHVIDTDRLDLSLTGEHMGREVRASIELDALQRPVAYWVLDRHPFDGSLRGLAMPRLRVGEGMRRVEVGPAGLCVLRPRPGQLRGRSPLSAVIHTVRFHEAFGEAAIQQAIAAACVAFVTTGAVNPFGAQGQESEVWGTPGGKLQEMTPGLIVHAGSDGDVKTVNPQGLMSPNFQEVERLMLRRLAAGMRAPFSALSGDYSQTTFSSERASVLHARKRFSVLQQVVDAECTGPFYDACVAWDLLSGAVVLDADEQRHIAEHPGCLACVHVVPEGWGWVNPQQEAQADAIAFAHGFKSLRKIAAADGEDWKQVIEQRAEELAYTAQVYRKHGLQPPVASLVTPTTTPTTPAPAPTPDDAAGDEKDNP